MIMVKNSDGTYKLQYTYDADKVAKLQAQYYKEISDYTIWISSIH